MISEKRLGSEIFANYFRGIFVWKFSNFNSLKCGDKFILSLVYPFLETKNKNQIFRK